MNKLSNNYRKKLARYYTMLEQAAREEKIPTIGVAATALLDNCLSLPSPQREIAFVEGVMAMSTYEDTKWIPKAA